MKIPCFGFGLSPILLKLLLFHAFHQTYVSGNCNINSVYSFEQYDSYDDYEDDIDYTYAVCVARDLNEDTLVLRKNTSNLKYIMFVNSSINLIPAGVFNKYCNISKLYLNNSEVVDIQAAAFNGLSSLEELYLQNNNITKVSVGVYNLMAKLNILNLAYNCIESIDEHAFSGNLKLTNLYLNNNQITLISPNLFQERPLTSVDLSFNTIRLNATNFNFEVFSNSTLHLKLRSTGIKSFRNLHHLSKLINLDVSNNSLSYVEDLTCESLTFLNLSNNLISQLSSFSFSNLRSLEALFLESNLISQIPMGCFHNLDWLEVLNLSRNNISHIDLAAFEGLYNLVDLDLSNNNLTEIDEATFFLLDRLKHLNIANNNINQINFMLLLKQLHDLNSIELHNNPWSCIDFSKVLFAFKKAGVTVKNGYKHNTAYSNNSECQQHAHSPVKADFYDLFRKYMDKQEKGHNSFLNEITRLHYKLSNQTNNQFLSVSSKFNMNDVSNLLEALNKREDEFQRTSNTNTAFLIIISLAIVCQTVLFIVRYYKSLCKGISSSNNNVTEINPREIEMQ